MKSRDPHVGGRREPQRKKMVIDALTHLLGRFIGEGDGKKLLRWDEPLSQKKNDASGEHASLSRASSCNHQKGFVCGGDGISLSRIKVGCKLI